MRGAVLPHVTSQHYVFSYKINERSSSKVKGQGQRSRSVKIYIITKIPYYRGLYYFSKSSIFEKYIGHRGLSVCLLLFEIFDFRKVYWSPRSVCLFVCLSVCLFVCLSVCLFVRLQTLYRSHGWSDRPEFFSKRCRLDTRQCRTFFLENRIKCKVKVTTFVKNR